ncbi:XRE family transcriptional regulator [Thauera mechernichensis]
MKMKTYTGAEVRELRLGRNLNQSDFWAFFQTTQSGGSRYESGRAIPDSIQVLLNLTFSTKAKATALLEEMRTLGKTTKRARALPGSKKA